MTTAQAIVTVENQLTSLGLKDRLGGELLGLEAFGAVYQERPTDWDSLLNRIGSGEITPAEYVSGAEKLIKAFTLGRFLRRVERGLT